jgi:hypothetical protein
MKLILLILFWCNISFAYTVDIYDATESGMVVIEAIDDCNYSHKLLISLQNASTHKPTDWIELLMISGEWNKCIDNGV